jgi:hypothetical protein
MARDGSMGTTLEELGLDTPLDDWSIPGHADGTKTHAGIPFSGLFDGPDIVPPSHGLLFLHDLT